MPLPVGTRLGPYEIAGLIGKGGMGEVYRARDTALKRDVALKVLPAGLSDNPDRMARFQREAEVLASLDHPNIGQIYGIVEADGVRALALALIEGPTLEDRIASGPIPLDEALAIARQIIDALEYAHERGVIHRDLKPANIKINPDGLVKVLDFGLAKVLEDEPPASSPAESPTLTLGHTLVGTILGTAAYMSPEQAVGRPVDRRSDIFSFGAVLYEMLTGERAFRGATTPDVVEAVVKSDPDWSKLPAQTAPAIRNLVQGCLVKDRKLRLQAIGEARIALINPLLEGAAPPQSHLRSAFWPAAAAVLAVALAGASWIAYRAAQPAEPKPLVRLDLELDPPVATALGSGPILSPDGSRMVYVAKGQLYTRRFDQAETTEMKGTEGASSPFFSPDGQWVGFYNGTFLKKTSIGGGEIVQLSRDASPLHEGGAWGRNGTVFFPQGALPHLARIPAADGAAEPITEPTSQISEVNQAFPQILPGGKLLLYTGRASVSGQADDSYAVALSLPDRRRKIVQRNTSMARYVSLPDGSGYLLYVNGGTLFAAPFNTGRLEAEGAAVPVLNDVLTFPFVGAQFDVCANGTLIYQHGKNAGGTLQWLDAAGKLQPLLMKPGPYGRPKISPHGTRVAFDNEGNIWTYDWQSEIMSRLTSNGGLGALWSPDSRFVLFFARGAIDWIRSDGGTAPHELIRGQTPFPWSSSPDGKRLAYGDITPDGGDLYTAAIENDGAGLKAGTPEPYLKTPANERYPSFSPDGHWIAYASNESGVQQVYVRAFPDKGEKTQISSGGGAYPEWSSDRRTIFFRTPDNRIMTANYTVQGDSFMAEKPRFWSEQHLAEVGVQNNYDLHPDGKRIMAVMPAGSSGESADASHVTIRFNFFEELRRRVPAAK